MNGLSCVKGEIHNVLAVLRITGRFSGGGFFDFGSSHASTSREHIEILRHKLLTSFKELHLLLTLQSSTSTSNHSNLHSIDTTVFIRPFCDVLLSDGIRGIDVMNVTLTALHKFLLYGLITSRSMKSFEAINKVLLHSIFHIKFDDHSRSDKELIHIRIMEILLELLRSSAGYLVGNDNVCLCVQKCFEFRAYHRHYHKTNNCLMVRYTENVLMQMVLLVFNKIKTLPSHHTHAVTATASVAVANAVEQTQTQPQPQTQPPNSSKNEAAFDTHAMVRILKYLTIIINPNQLDTSADLREFGLRLLNVALETSGDALNNYASLIGIVQDDLCRQLLINSQSSNFMILSLTLRVIFDLFIYCKQQIRVQLEVFFISIHLRIAESASSSFEQKELVLESIVEFCREPDLIVGLYTNYDCQVGSTHLFEDLCNFLLNCATIDSSTMHDGSINNLHLIAAEGILAIIDCIARKFIDDRRSGGGGGGSGDDAKRERGDDEHKDEHDEIMRSQKKKRKLKLAARAFNAKLDKSVAYLQQIGTLSTPLAAQDVAQFLHTNAYLDKIKIGEYLGKKAEFNGEVRECYVDLFDFRHLAPDEALRVFLESFVLRGEAQQIERILEKFSEKLYEHRPSNSPLKSTDAAFILSYSMIQLNTDAHNNQIKDKMQIDAYQRQLKGVNDGDSFPDKFLHKIYHSVTTNEIKVRSGNFKDIFDKNENAAGYPYFDEQRPFLYPDEEDDHHDADMDDNDSMSSSGSSFFLDPYASPSAYNVKDVKKSEWMLILKKSQKLHRFKTCAPPTNGAEMFNILWEPALSILQFHLRFAKHPKVLHRVVQGIHTLARIAHCYQIRSAFNAIIHTFCNHLMMCLLQFGTQNQLLPATFDSRVYNQQSSSGVANDKSASLSSIHSNVSDMDHPRYASISVPYFLSAAPRGGDDSKLNHMFDDISQFVDGEIQDSNILAIDIRITYTIKAFFELVKDYGGLLMTDGWSSVMKVLLWLFHLDLIPHQIFEMEDFTDSAGLPLPSLSDPVPEQSANADTSVGSALTSWFSTAFGSIFTNPATSEAAAAAAARTLPSTPLSEPDKDNHTDFTLAASTSKPTPHGEQTINSGSGGDTNSGANKPSNLAQHDAWVDPKCQSIVNAVNECTVSDLFTSSKSYHVHCFVHLVRTLISLSNTQCENTVAASSFIVEKERAPLRGSSASPNPAAHAEAAKSKPNDITPSVTTHTLTSLDPVPIATSQLMDSFSDATKLGGGSRDGSSLLLDDERKNGVKYSQNSEDVICLPLTIDMKIFCLERLSQVLTANIDRIQVVWKLIMEHYESLIVAQQRNALKHKQIDDDPHDNSSSNGDRGRSSDGNNAHGMTTYVLPSESESDAVRHSHYFFERITVNILKLCVELTEMEVINKLENVSTFLNLFLTLDDSIVFVIGRRVIAGIKLLLNIQSENYDKYVRKQQRKQTDLSTTATAYYGQCFKQEKDWKIVCFLMKRFASNRGDKQCVLEAFHVIELISKSHLEITNFNYVLHVLTAFGKHEIEAPVHNTRVIEVILSIHSRLVLISKHNETVLGQMWHKTLSNISTFGTTTDYITRRFAINCLHKALLQYPIEISNKQSFVEPLKLLFQTVLFPLLLQLTKVENERIVGSKSVRGNRADEITEDATEQHTQMHTHGSSNEENTDDLRLKLLTLIFQLWLHDMNILLDYDTANFHTLWYNFLTTIRKFIFMVNKAQHTNDNLVMHCCESLKNVILVFQSSNVFQTLADKTGNDVWNDTWVILGDCAPDLKQEFVQITQQEIGNTEPE